MSDVDPSLLRTWLHHWHDLLRPSFPFESPSDLAGAINDLARMGDASLARALAPLPCGGEILERLRDCLAGNDVSSVYLRVRPAPASDEELVGLAEDARRRAVCLAEDVDLLKLPIRIVRGRGDVDYEHSGDPFEALRDHLIDLGHAMNEPNRTARRFLHEALHTVAASPEVRDYCLTPLFPSDVRAMDPMQPQVELWRRGAQLLLTWPVNDSDGARELLLAVNEVVGGLAMEVGPNEPGKYR